MKFVFLAICGLALSVPLVNGGPTNDFHDHNFVVAYGLSTILQRTGFSNILDDSLNITGRAKYLRYFAPIEDQLTMMIHESFLQLPPAVFEQMIGTVKELLNTTLPALEKKDPALVRDLDEKMRKDISKMMRDMAEGGELIASYLRSGKATSIQKQKLSELSSYMKRLYRYMQRRFGPMMDTPNLKWTIMFFLDIFGKLPKFSHYQRDLCPVVKDEKLEPVFYALTLSKEFLPYHLRKTQEFLKNLLIKNMGRRLMRVPPVLKMMAHFGAVLGHNTVEAIKRFVKVYAMDIFKDQVRLLLAIAFRPKGTFTRAEDFVPYMESLNRAIRRLPENMQKAFSSESISKLLNITNIPAFIELMKQPHEVMKLCVGSFRQLPKDILQKLQARPGFDNDAKDYCELVEVNTLYLMHFPELLQSYLVQLEKQFGIPAAYVNMTNATFAPENVPFIGFNGDNPNAFYKQVLSKGAQLRVNRTIAANAKDLFPLVADRVRVLSRVMFGADACSTHP